VGKLISVNCRRRRWNYNTIWNWWTDSCFGYSFNVIRSGYLRVISGISDLRSTTTLTGMNRRCSCSIRRFFFVGRYDHCLTVETILCFIYISEVLWITNFCGKCLIFVVVQMVNSLFSQTHVRQMKSDHRAEIKLSDDTREEWAAVVESKWTTTQYSFSSRLCFTILGVSWRSCWEKKHLSTTTTPKIYSLMDHCSSTTDTRVFWLWLDVVTELLNELERFELISIAYSTQESSLPSRYYVVYFCWRFWNLWLRKRIGYYLIFVTLQSLSIYCESVLKFNLSLF
jgi:hypothetical protein